MKIERPNYQKLELERYLRRGIASHRNESSLRKNNEELLRLLFAYARKQNNLHLRRNRIASINLAFLTVEELFKKKKKDPTLNKVYDRLVAENNLPDEELKEILLESADRILNGTSARNKVISKGPRKRKKHPLKILLEGLINGHPSQNHIWLRNKVIMLGIEKGIIYQNDTERERIVFHDEVIVDITYKTISVWVKAIKESKKSKSDLTS
jgi:hypothetical protein